MCKTEEEKERDRKNGGKKTGRQQRLCVWDVPGTWQTELDTTNFNFLENYGEHFIVQATLSKGYTALKTTLI